MDYLDTKAINILLFSSVVVIQSYLRWKKIYLEETKQISEKFIKTGYIVIPSGISSSLKAYSWNKHILPTLKHHWKEQNFDVNNVDTWPVTKTAYHLTYTKQIDHLPKVFSRNKYIQAVIAYLFDPELKFTHFGIQTHWTLKLFIQPLWLISDLFMPTNMYIINGIDQSWHIVNVPTLDKDVNSIHSKSKSRSRPKPYSSHMDAGAEGIYGEIGIPYHSSCNLEIFWTLEDRMLAMIMQQIGIIFYCENPGLLGIEEGATGFYEGSHVTLLSTLKSFLREQKSIDRIPWNIFHEALKSIWSSLSNLHPVELKEEEVLLAFGCLIHTPMIATTLMNGSIRTLLNCKVYLCDEVRKNEMKLYQFIQSIPTQSLLRSFIDSVDINDDNNDGSGGGDGDNNSSYVESIQSDTSTLYAALQQRCCIRNDNDSDDSKID